MKAGFLDKLVEAVLYEGHILYPYRASSQKNRQRFTFGRVYPACYSEAQSWAEPCVMQTECLVRPLTPSARVWVEVRFLHPMAREIGILEQPLSTWVTREKDPTHRLVPFLEMEGHLYQAWQEAAERRVSVEVELDGGTGPKSVPFSFDSARTVEPILNADGRIPALIIRRNERVCGDVSVLCEPLWNGFVRLSVRIENQTPMAGGGTEDGDALLLHTFTSTHTILAAEGAEFLSVTAPPDDMRDATEGCHNVGTWPVLVGDEGETGTMLSSPIVLPDYPQLAPESAGSLFDGTEIDEILTLRILTMTDAEKREMRNIDEHARKLLERTESLPAEHILAMHGAMRKPQTFDEAIFGGNTRIEAARVSGIELRAGDVVRIRPKARADVMDMALAGRRAIIESVEEDAEGKVHLALVIDDDPGRDLGLMRQTGHRFFYGLDEVEACPKGEVTP